MQQYALAVSSEPLAVTYNKDVFFHFRHIDVRTEKYTVYRSTLFFPFEFLSSALCTLGRFVLASACRSNGLAQLVQVIVT